MFAVELYAKIRRSVIVDGMSRREAATQFGVHRNTITKMLQFSIPPGYRRRERPASKKLGPYMAWIDAILEGERGRWRNNFIAENDLVFAIWQEPLAKCGIGLLVLKGDDVLRRSMSENWTRLATVRRNTRNSFAEQETLMNRHLPDDGLVEAEIAAFDRFWQCQFLGTGLSCTQASDIGAPTVENVDFVVIQTQLSFENGLCRLGALPPKRMTASWSGYWVSNRIKAASICGENDQPKGKRGQTARRERKTNAVEQGVRRQRLELAG